MFEYSCLLTLPVAVFVSCSLVVLFLALCHAYAQFGATFVPVQIERHQRHSLALDSANQSIEFLSVQ